MGIVKNKMPKVGDSSGFASEFTFYFIFYILFIMGVSLFIFEIVN